jgi:hypothetical protein
LNGPNGQDLTITVKEPAPGLIAAYGVAPIKSTTPNDRPNLDFRVVADTQAAEFKGVANGNFLCVEITAPDMSTINTYGFHLIVADDVDEDVYDDDDPPNVIGTINGSLMLKGGVTISGAGITTVNIDKADLPTPSIFQSGSIGNYWAGWTAGLNTKPVVLTGLPSEITVTVPPASIPSGAKVYYGSNFSNSANPANWSTTGILINPNIGMYIGIRVVSQQGSIAHYRFQIASGTSADATITGATVNGVSVTLPAPGSTWNAGLATGTAIISDFPAAITVGTTGQQAGAGISWGISAAAATAPSIWYTSPIPDVAGGSYLGIRVVSPSGGTTNIYRFRLVRGSGTSADLNTATVGGVSVETLPAGAATFAAAVAGTITLSGAAALNPLVVTATAGTDTTIRYGTSAANGTAPANYNSTGQFSNVAPNTYIDVEVTSPDFSSVQHYKFQVTLP